ncbi:hypothetical protein O0L34_g6945 [Tuta absoluta]|nr:hypothetical protein O0L34_g6945 [Tuta absoluta]
MSKTEAPSTSCVKRCCVNGCNKNTRTHPHYSFFRFPVEKERYVKWLEAIDRPDILEKGFQLASYRVCESHFPRSCISTYIRPSHPKNKQLTRVAKNAVPTLNLPVKRSDESLVSQTKEEEVLSTHHHDEQKKYVYSFMLPSRRVELTTCPVEIVSIPPDPQFDKCVIENNYIPNQQYTDGRNNAVLQQIVNDHPIKEEGCNFEFKNKGHTEVSTIEIEENANQSLDNSLENTNQQSTAERILFNKGNYSSDCQPSSSQSHITLNSLTDSTICNLSAKDNFSKNTYNNLIMKMTQKQQLIQNIVDIGVEDDNYFLTNKTSNQLVSIRPVLNNMIELNPEILIPPETLDESNEVNIFSNADTIDTKADLNHTLDDDEMVVVVQIADDDEMSPSLDSFNIDTFNVQPVNQTPETFLGTDVETNSEGNADSRDLKEENIEDLLDASDSQLI